MHKAIFLAVLLTTAAAGETKPAARPKPTQATPPALRQWRAVAAGTQVKLASPLTTVIAATLPPVRREDMRFAASDGRLGDLVVVAELEVPADAPDDLGVGAFASDQHGTWFQRLHPDRLHAGRNQLHLRMTGGDLLQPGQGTAGWNQAVASLTRCGGLFLWSAKSTGVAITVISLEARRIDPPAPEDGHRLLDLRWDPTTLATGSRWSASLRPDPFPSTPEDPAEFAVEAQITAPDGTTRTIPGFHRVPQQVTDRGDREMTVPSGTGAFELRFRPDRPGTHQVRLTATWGDGSKRTVDLPPLVVSGEAQRSYVTVDGKDPRFFALGGSFYWPIGINLHTPNDPRCQRRYATTLTTDRGLTTYTAYLDRCAAAGIDAAEIWMSSWNFALEWRADWPGFHGIGRVNQANAERLDRLLDLAWQRGIRVNLVVNNHGQASDGTDREWENNPWNPELGGPLNQAADLMSSEVAMAGQDRIRRYLAGRFADHPAILGWKLFSEISLTAGQRAGYAPAWHAQAAARWGVLDTYDHPRTTHWHGDYKQVDDGTATAPGLDYLCIDAYLRRGGGGNDLTLPEMLAVSLDDPQRGLNRHGRAVLVTEYGSGPLAGELGSGPFVGLVCGFAGAPMTWWHEWVDQKEWWSPYRAIRAFAAGEDLRGGRSVVLSADRRAGPLWARAWVRPGRILAYCCDRQWSYESTDPVTSSAQLNVGNNIAPGKLVEEWWNADNGTLIARKDRTHAGGAMVLETPPFSRHIAVKLIRR
ncbi:hypothetical protein LBMAG53_28560 [Planctomycetota bacterium]|nr:hypothetical protein LBMAG53_28560 [Planctomycetota bacterium]